MRVTLSISTLLISAISLITNTCAAPDPNFHIYLAFGQSNMQGAGQIANQDKTVDKRFQMLATAGGCNNRQVGNWYDAIPPLAHCGGGLGPVDYFGRNLIKNLPSQIKVGVVVVAVAGCDIQLFEKDNYRSYNMADWMKSIVNSYGGNPYGRLVEMGKKAQQAGVIKGILFHQGETNSGQQNWPNRVKGIYDNLIKDLGLKASEVPLLAGELVSSAKGGVCGGHNSIIQRLPQVIPNAHVISSSGLDQQGDGLHFTSAAYRTFGQRFAETMLKLLGDVKTNTGSQGSQGNQTGQTGQGSQGGQTASTSNKITDGWYYIKNSSSGKYLSVRNGVGANAQNVEIGSSKQKWKVTKNNDGSVVIISEFGNFALDIANGSGDNGANVQIYTTHGGDAQKFIIRETSNSGIFVIDTIASGGSKALDIEGGRSADGTNICQWDDSAKSNQTWTFEAVGGSNNGGNQNPVNPSQEASCWSTSLGYPCCSSCVNAAYQDNDGYWGVENDDWCGIPKSCSASSNASSCMGAQGYPCCKSTCLVYSEDGDGQWSIENNDWCLIDKSKC
jgi:hypothetical protein